jgi:hypothetical protein
LASYQFRQRLGFSLLVYHYAQANKDSPWIISPRGAENDERIFNDLPGLRIASHGSLKLPALAMIKTNGPTEVLLVRSKLTMRKPRGFQLKALATQVFDMPADTP